MALLKDKTATPDIFEIEIDNGDKLLLCSDGLTNMVIDYDINKIIRKSESIEDAVRTLINTANENGGKDNISAILISAEYTEIRIVCYLNNRSEKVYVGKRIFY